MRLSRLLSTAMILTLAWTTVAAAAVLRTAPFPGDGFGSGSAACYVTNTSGSAGTVSATLYDMSGDDLKSLHVSVPGHATVVTDYQPLSEASPTHCVCVVPSATTYRCSFVYADKDHPTISVIGAP